ncbi:hypothetical protein BV22DRAFT_1036148 [Leucogyrophana mollusca]|uniref:Uncharacterized protein n=1 Tax=Leucogyrophana mollusca TaxID=85980 RepID=A0ACB8BCY5_9AGAM|nr:hypothetical protein BV22DRAFT_1036148 [Leucogyrophana mollusca]
MSIPERRSLLSTPSRRILDWQLASSPSPLPPSLGRELGFSDLSPPAKGLTGTPFEYQFLPPSQEWTTSVDESPVARNDSALVPSPCAADGGDDDCEHPAHDSTVFVPRVSLVEKFLAVLPSMSPGPTYPPSPRSTVSTLTPLPSPQPSHSAEYDLSYDSDKIHRYNTRSRPGEPELKHDAPLDLEPRKRAAPTPDSPRPKKRARNGLRRPDRNGSPQKSDSHLDPDSRSPLSPDSTTPAALLQRTFPTDIPIHPQLTLLYRRFPVSSYFQQPSDDHTCVLLHSRGY